MKNLLRILLVLIIVSCSNDENPELSDTIISETLNNLTDGDTKTWVISEAILVNERTGTELDISNSSNVTDDRFVFSLSSDTRSLSETSGSVTWKQREAINWEATSSQELFKDLYLSNENYELDINEANSASFTAFNTLQSFSVLDENTVSGTISLESDIEFRITLRPITNQDIPTVPTSIDFTEVASFILDGDNTIGCTSSEVTNKIYFSERGSYQFENCDVFNGLIEETIYTYDIFTGFFEKLSFCQPSGFVTKELEIIDGNLISLSSESCNTYSISLDQNPNVNEFDFNDTDQRAFTRQGTATFGNDIYITGSDFFKEELSDRIYKYDNNANQLEIITHMPSSKYFADAEIVDNKLYIFGGTPSFGNNFLTPEDHIYIYDFDTETWEIEYLSIPILDTFSVRYGDLIYIGGYTFFDTDGDGDRDRTENYIGVYNTNNRTFTNIPLSLNTTAYGSFKQITILNNKLYLLIGSDPNDEYKLYETTLP